MEHRNMGEENDKSGEEGKTNIFLSSEVPSWLMNLPKHTQELHNGTKTKNSVISLIQDSAGCIQITEPSKGSKNDLCDLRTPTTVHSEVSCPRGIITKKLQAVGKICLVF